MRVIFFKSQYIGDWNRRHNFLEDLFRDFFSKQKWHNFLFKKCIVSCIPMRVINNVSYNKVIDFTIVLALITQNNITLIPWEKRTHQINE